MKGQQSPSSDARYPSTRTEGPESKRHSQHRASQGTSAFRGREEPYVENGFLGQLAAFHLPARKLQVQVYRRSHDCRCESHEVGDISAKTKQYCAGSVKSPVCNATCARAPSTPSRRAHLTNHCSANVGYFAAYVLMCKL